MKSLSAGGNIGLAGAAMFRRRLAFTLVEMLAVIVIVSLLIALLAPAIGTIIRGPLLTQASDSMVGILNLAQQTAEARNLSVEVRFYQYADSSYPGETTTNPASGKYRAIQIFLVNPTGTLTPLNAVQTFPVGIIADTGPTLSTLVVPSTSSSAQQKTWSPPTDPQLSLPRSGLNYNCCWFRFRPDGSTYNLQPTGNWFITLHNILDGDGRTTPPANYATIQLDPINGASTVYTP